MAVDGCTESVSLEMVIAWLGSDTIQVSALQIPQMDPCEYQMNRNQTWISNEFVFISIDSRYFEEKWYQRLMGWRILFNWLMARMCISILVMELHSSFFLIHPYPCQIQRFFFSSPPCIHSCHHFYLTPLTSLLPKSIDHSSTRQFQTISTFLI